MRESLQKGMLTFEPLRLVNVRPPEKPDAQEVTLQTLELSNLDHPYDAYPSVALFYAVNAGGTQQCASLISDDDPAKKLQTALEELLVHYPAAAGRLHINESSGRYEVKYKAPSGLTDDEDASYGVPFIVARANTAFSALGDVTAPHPSLDVLYPSAPVRSPDNQLPRPVVLVQVTTFTCGSFVLGFMSSHLLTDAYAAAVLLKNLCSIAKGAGLAISMDMTNRREVVKPRVPPSPTAWPPHIGALEQGATHEKEEVPSRDATRFSFNATFLEALKLRASGLNGKSCSRFQALIAFLWITRAKCLANSGALLDRELPLRFPFNIRGKESNNFTNEYIGNAIFMCIVPATVQELCERSFTEVVEKIALSVNQAIHNLGEYVQSEIDYIELQLQKGCVPYIYPEFLAMSSLVNLPFYDTDCGWGRPIYCGCPSQRIGERMMVLDDPLSKCWNVHIPLLSQEDYKFFQKEIEEFKVSIG